MKQKEKLILRKINVPVRLMQIREGMAFPLTGEVSTDVLFPESAALLWAVNQKPACFLFSVIRTRKIKNFHLFPATMLMGNSGKFWLQDSSGLESFVLVFLLVHCNNNLNALGSGPCWRGGLFGTVKMWKSCIISLYWFRHHFWQD